MERAWRILVAAFLTEAPARLAALRRARAERDLIGLRSAAHALEGGAQTLGAVTLARLCRALESHPEAADTDALLGRIEIELYHVRQALEELPRPAAEAVTAERRAARRGWRARPRPGRARP